MNLFKNEPIQKPESDSGTKKIGILRLRSDIKAPDSITNTLETLHLNALWNLTITAQDRSILGKLRKLRNYVSWGFLSEAQVKLITSVKKFKTLKVSKKIGFCPPYKGISKKQASGYNPDFYQLLLRKFVLRSSYKTRKKNSASVV